MTNHERAEKIVRDYNYGHAAELTVEAKGYVADITSQLDEAVREVKLECESFHATNQECFDEGFASAREKAAGIAKDHAKVKGAHIHEGFKFCVEEVADRIRAMEPDQ